jgi:hypothetical protein
MGKIQLARGVAAGRNGGNSKHQCAAAYMLLVVFSLVVRDQTLIAEIGSLSLI